MRRPVPAIGGKHQITGSRQFLMESLQAGITCSDFNLIGRRQLGAIRLLRFLSLGRIALIGGRSIFGGPAGSFPQHPLALSITILKCAGRSSHNRRDYLRAGLTNVVVFDNPRPHQHPPPRRRRGIAVLRSPRHPAAAAAADRASPPMSLRFSANTSSALSAVNRSSPAHHSSIE